MTSLDDPRVANVLDRLHRAARGDWLFFARNLPMMARAIFSSQPIAPPGEQAALFKDVYIPISRAQGRFLYLVARSIGARRIVEFGTSFGVSTIYAAAAARDDNIKTFRRALAPYVEYVQSGRNGFASITLPLKDGFEYSVRLADEAGVA